MQAHEQKSQYLDRFHMVTLSVMPLVLYDVPLDLQMWA